MNFYRWHNKVSTELRVSDKQQEKLEILNATISLLPLEEEIKREASMTSWSFKDPRKSLQNFNDYYSKSYERSRLKRLFLAGNFSSYGVYTRLEQSPNRESRITLNENIDTLGMPKVDLHWAFTTLDKKSLRESNILLGQQIGAIGLGRLKLNDFLADENDKTMPETISGGWHHIGTTKMNKDPKKGVVDENCKVHGINNLYVAGSSCFPTAGAVNPTLSIVAMSLRLSNYLQNLFMKIIH